jgi:hypothetical protein
VIEKAKKEIADARAKLVSMKDSDLTWETKRLLRLYAQGFHDWCSPGERKPLSWYYERGLRYYGKELRRPETISSKTLYSLGFMAYYRGQPDRKKQEKSEIEFWLLARTIAPKACEELIMHKGLEHLYKPEDLETAREFLADLDETLAEPPEEHEASGGTASVR